MILKEMNYLKFERGNIWKPVSSAHYYLMSDKNSATLYILVICVVGFLIYGYFADVLSNYF